MRRHEYAFRTPKITKDEKRDEKEKKDEEKKVNAVCRCRDCHVESLRLGVV